MILIVFEIRPAKYFHFWCELLDIKRKKVLSCAQFISTLLQNSCILLTLDPEHDPLVFGSGESNREA